MSRQLEIKPPVETKPGIVEKTAGGCLYLAISLFNLRDTLRDLLSTRDEKMVAQLIPELERFYQKLKAHEQGTLPEEPVPAVPRKILLVETEEFKSDLIMLQFRVIQLIETGSSKYEEALKVVLSFEQKYLDAGANEIEFTPIKALCDEVRGWIYFIASGNKDVSSADQTQSLLQALRYFLDSQADKVNNLLEEDPDIVLKIQQITGALAKNMNNKQLADIAAQMDSLWY